MAKSKQSFDEHRNRFPADDEHVEKIKHDFEQYEHHPDELKKRVIYAKKHLPNGIVPLFVHVFPEFDTYKKRSRVTNVLQLRIADSEITEKLEILVDRLNNKKS